MFFAGLGSLLRSFLFFDSFLGFTKAFTVLPILCFLAEHGSNLPFDGVVRYIPCSQETGGAKPRPRGTARVS